VWLLPQENSQKRERARKKGPRIGQRSGAPVSGEKNGSGKPAKGKKTITPREKNDRRRDVGEKKTLPTEAGPPGENRGKGKGDETGGAGPGEKVFGARTRRGAGRNRVTVRKEGGKAEKRLPKEVPFGSDARKKSSAGIQADGKKTPTHRDKNQEELGGKGKKNNNGGGEKKIPPRFIAPRSARRSTFGGGWSGKGSPALNLLLTRQGEVKTKGENRQTIENPPPNTVYPGGAMQHRVKKKRNNGKETRKKTKKKGLGPCVEKRRPTAQAKRIFLQVPGGKNGPPQARRGEKEVT